MSACIDFNKPIFYTSIAFIVFNPLFWNVVARIEYWTKVLTKLAGGAYMGCKIFGAVIFVLGLMRNYMYAMKFDNYLRFYKALIEQPSTDALSGWNFKLLALMLLIWGNVLVTMSYKKLGFEGTFMGDYFGILKTERIVSFPFNVVKNPMYTGSTCIFAAVALLYQSAAGLLLTVVVHLTYKTALLFEE